MFIVPPCVPHLTPCTGATTLPPGGGGCTSTLDLRPTTVTLPGANPACPATPTTTSQLGCPTVPACWQRLCATVTLGTPGEGAGSRETVTDKPMDCVATTTYTFAKSSTTRPPVEATVRATPPSWHP